MTGIDAAEFPDCPGRRLPAGFPDVPGGYVEATLELGDRRLRYRRPAAPDRMLDLPEVVAAFDRDGDAPYWPLQWPPAEAMARAVYRAGWPREATILEVGCGIGLASLAAAARGSRVTVSDNQSDAVRLAVANAALNDLDVEGYLLDWRTPIEARYDRILGCEVIYDATLHAPLLALLNQMLSPGGEAWLADHGRMHTPLFAERAKTAGFAVSLVDELDQPLAAFRTAEYQLLKLRRMP